ncbi:hypothetical protein E4U10_001326 [Claviceps purpurea]|nr:hypothetical protein E4U28_003181 [Claviceps purpurea]KAG6155604.1 hypothetical protein E4U37_001008 [Claviceps purpurea]KAG6200899.1 hypothetical protein E4U10_001326 [Claviceps purpurea]
MSNQAVGAVYQIIIDEVINTSRVDFEESGVEEHVLEELRQGWQQKLTQLDVARFPWDPKPEAPPPAPPAPRAASQSAAQAQFPPNQTQGYTGYTGHNGVRPEQGYVKNEVEIKHEPGMQPLLPAIPSFNAADKNSLAASRAAQRLADQYGSRAAGSISAIQAGHKPHPPQGQQPQGQQPQSQQPQGQQPQGPQGQANGGGASSLSNGQTDGPGDAVEEDYEGILMQRSAEGTLHELARVDIDRLLHGQIAARAKAMEGGGLMLPLKEAASRAGPSAARTRAKGKAIAGYDGADEDEDIDDEDAINSDLDDPEDDNDEDEVDDEGLGHIMLCMYDKVQRVKNKWKCTLKDGVLTVNGKEYVFHKATGEYEW